MKILTLREIQILHSEMLNYFQSTAELNRFVSERMNESHKYIYPDTEKMATQIDDLLRWSEQRGLFENLLASLHAKYPENTVFARLLGRNPELIQFTSTKDHQPTQQVKDRLTGNRRKVFISYSHRDYRWVERLRVHMHSFEDEYGIELWSDRKIQAGSEWKKEISHAIDKAEIVILLVSPDFLASEFIRKNELPPILANAEKQGTTIISLIVSPSRFSATETISRFQASNDPSKPLIALTRANQEKALVKLSIDVEKILNKTQQV